MTLRVQLALGLVTIVFFAFALSEFGVRNSERLNREAYEIGRESIFELTNLDNLESHSKSIFDMLSSDASPTSEPTVLGRSDSLAWFDGELEEAWEILEKIYYPDPASHPLSVETKEILDQFRASSRACLVETERRGVRQCSDELPRLLIARDELARIVNLLKQTNLAEFGRRQQASQGLSDAVFRLNLGLRLAALLIAAAAGLLMARAISQPITQLQHAASRIAQGQAGVSIRISGPRELEALVEAFNGMSVELKNNMVSRTYLESIIDSMADSLIVIENDDTIRLANTPTLILLGYSREDLLALPFASIITSDSEASDKPHLRLDSGVWETAYRHCNGTLIPVRLSISQIVDPANQAMTSFVCVAQDLREQRVRQEELLRYRHRLQHAEQLASLGTLSAVVAHRISQPLTSMRLFVQQSLRALRETGGFEVTCENLQYCLDELARVSTTVSDLLRFTRRPVENKAVGVSLLEIARKTVQVLASQARDMNIELRIENMDELPLIDGAQEELEELFFVLAKNAIDAAPVERPSKLIICGEVEAARVHLYFADTCSGIAAEHLEQVFKEFFTTKPRGKGTGLGLSIAVQIVRHHDGKIQVESEEGKGSRFIVSLPIAAEG